jgi:hypothetical protein
MHHRMCLPLQERLHVLVMHVKCMHTLCSLLLIFPHICILYNVIFMFHIVF